MVPWHVCARQKKLYYHFQVIYATRLCRVLIKGDIVHQRPTGPIYAVVGTRSLLFERVVGGWASFLPYALYATKYRSIKYFTQHLP